MSSIYLFDVDGTLTDAKCKIENSFANELETWMDDKEVYIVSGGSFERIIDQLGTNIMSKVSGVFACMGNIFYSRIEHINPPKYEEWEIIYENKFKTPRGLYKDLNKLVDESEFYNKTGRHYEERVGMVNFSIVGRNANTAARNQYSNYDAEFNERVRIVEVLKEKYPKLDFVVGGAVSIDIFNKGNDKSQIVNKHFKEAIRSNKVVFVGDRVDFPGNDYALANKLKKRKNGKVLKVDSWQDTQKLLKTEPFT
jgi:hydroxymethylpyrimidine pyrophosphatase-like HAD family hydrolase